MKLGTFLIGSSLARITSSQSMRLGGSYAPRDTHEQAVAAREEFYITGYQTCTENVKYVKTVTQDPEVTPEPSPAVGLKAGAGNVHAAPVLEEQPKQGDDNKANQSGPQEAQNPASPVVADDGGRNGVTYSAYGPKGCRTLENFRKDWAPFKGKYSTVRLYGVDCSQVHNGLTVAEEIGVKLMLGVFYIPNAVDQANILINEVGGKWNLVHSVVVGNEAVSHWGQSVDAVVGAVGAVRSLLRAKGFDGPVLTVATHGSVLADPWPCEVSDICGVNMHPWFHDKGTLAASGVKEFMEENVAALKKVTTKPIYVTETGWPWAGGSNGLAIASKEEQRIALDGIIDAFKSSPDRLILFASYNEGWKTEGVEPFWGMGATNHPSDS